jgi:hypothetical protein
MTGTTQRQESTAPISDRLLMAIELGRRQWKVGFTTQLGQRIHRRTLTADAWDRLAEMVAVAKKRLDLPTDAAVTSGDRPSWCPLIDLWSALRKRCQECT